MGIAYLYPLCFSQKNFCATGIAKANFQKIACKLPAKNVDLPRFSGFISPKLTAN
jgi:hypothetical protein